MTNIMDTVDHLQVFQTQHVGICICFCHKVQSFLLSWAPSKQPTLGTSPIQIIPLISEEVGKLQGSLL
jgi:hypothetical protein